jgi:hypothetical protein
VVLPAETTTIGRIRHHAAVTTVAGMLMSLFAGMMQVGYEIECFGVMEDEERLEKAKKVGKAQEAEEGGFFEQDLAM